MRRYILFVLLAILALSLVTTMYYPLSIILTVIVFWCTLEKFGKGIVLLETMALYSCIIYILMPILGYSVYNSDNRVAILWNRVMPVSSDRYYSFMLPAITTYIIGLFLINYSKGRPDEGSKLEQFVVRLKQRREQPGKVGLWLIGAGLIFYFVRLAVPGGLAAVASFGYLLIFPGLLYLHFQPSFRGRSWVYLVVTAFLVRDAINTGMFTVFFYMGITMVSFFFVGKRIRLPIKLGVVIIAICGVFILQLVKVSYRRNTWKNNYEGSKALLFQDLFIEKAAGFQEVFSVNNFFPIYARLNQGYVTAMVIRRIPSQQPYDDGESIAKTLAASLVPRVLWPDKPEAGGVYNMWHFAGFRLRGWSTNIGPVGEGYGNFGPTGGIIYMFFFGLFIGWAYKMVFVRARKTPLLLLWIPLLFFEVTYAMENDTLQAVNSLLKASFF
ncbi:MAG: hypothetical protein KGO82_18200, partial [Bacteroidota bacterium]|nr:hypothetical protein [Bacteroidota bacterium]